MPPIELKPGDPCPACGSKFVAARVPTAEMRKAAEDRENRIPLPPYYDTASEAQRQELGALHECGRCGYQTRFPLPTTRRGAAAQVEE